MESSNDLVIAVAWYRAEEWAELRLLCTDLDDTYQDWLTGAEAAVEDLKGKSFRVVKIFLTVDALRRWKRATGREIDGKTRSRLAERAARRADSRDK